MNETQKGANFERKAPKETVFSKVQNFDYNESSEDDNNTGLQARIQRKVILQLFF